MSRYQGSLKTALTRFRHVKRGTGPGELVVHDWVGSRNLVHTVQSTSKAEYRASVLATGVPPFNFAASDDGGEYTGEGIRTWSSIPWQEARLLNGPVVGDLVQLVAPTSTVESLSMDALASAMDKAAEWRSSVAVGVDLGESPETAAMAAKRVPQLFRGMTRAAANPWSAVASAMSAVGALAGGMHQDYQRYRRRRRRGQEQSMPHSATAVANWWLEARLGWGPLVGALDNAIKEMAANRNVGYVQTFVSSKHLRLQRQWAGTINQPMDGSAWKAAGTEVQDLDVEVKVYVSYRFAPIGVMDYTGSPIDIAWELIPFSFVVDRFVQIGNYLKRGTSLLGSERTRVGRVISTTLKRRIDVTGSGDLLSTASGKFEKTSRSYVRAPWLDASSHPAPIYTGGHSFENMKHVADYVALLTQMVRR